jgi:hypothetical protein
MNGRRSHAFVLPLVLVFMTTALALCALLRRDTGQAVRFAQVRQVRSENAYWSGHALAYSLGLLETGTPPTDPFICKLPLTNGQEVRYFRLTFDELTANNWQVDVEPTTLLDTSPLAPVTF